MGDPAFAGASGALPRVFLSRLMRFCFATRFSFSFGGEPLAGCCCEAAAFAK